MKTLLKIVVLVVPIMFFGQPADSLKIKKEQDEIRLLLKEKAKKQRENDSLQVIKIKELKKQQTLLSLIRKKIKDIFRERPETVIKIESPLPQIAVEPVGLKPPSDAVFCEDCFIEDVERTFFGKLFNKNKIRTRTYRFDQNGKKIYLD